MWGDLERDFEVRTAGKNTLWHRGMRALFGGDYDRAEVLLDKNRRVHRLGLRVLKGQGGEEAP